MRSAKKKKVRELQARLAEDGIHMTTQEIRKAFPNLNESKQRKVSGLKRQAKRRQK